MTIESPLFLDIALGLSLTGASFWAFVQAIERIRNWSLNRDLLDEQVRKATADRKLSELSLEKALHRRDAVPTFENVVRRLESDVEAADVELDAADYSP